MLKILYNLKRIIAKSSQNAKINERDITEPVFSGTFRIFQCLNL